MSPMSRSNRILFVIPTFAAGGAEKAMIDFVNGLQEDGIYQPELLVINEAIGPLRSRLNPAVPVHGFKWPKIYLGAPLVALTILRRRPAIVFSTMADLNFAVLMCRPLFPRLPVIVREAINPYFFKEAVPHRFKQFLWLWRNLYPWATHVIVNSPQARSELQEIVPKLPPVTMLNNVIDSDALRSQIKAAKPTADSDTYRMVAMGRLAPQKGFDRMIQSLADYPLPFKWQLEIYGHGEKVDIDPLQRLIDDTGQSDCIRLMGRTSQPGAILGHADVFVLPSRAEGMPNVALEALACGTPVVAMSEAGAIGTLAAEAPKDAIRIVSTMEEFMQVLATQKPSPARHRPDLVPVSFSKASAKRKLYELLDSVRK